MVQGSGNATRHKIHTKVNTIKTNVMVQVYTNGVMVIIILVNLRMI